MFVNVSGVTYNNACEAASQGSEPPVQVRTEERYEKGTFTLAKKALGHLYPCGGGI